MTNASINSKFLSTVDAATKARILQCIAQHYDISSEEALAEVTDSEAEHLLDYMTGAERSATSLLIQRYGFWNIAVK